MGSSIYSKKWTKTSQIRSFAFNDLKNHFEINWPLVVSNAKHFGPKSPYVNTKYKHRDKIALDPTYPWRVFYEQAKMTSRLLNFMLHKDQRDNYACLCKRRKKGVNPEFNGIPGLALKMSFVVKFSEIASAFINR